MRILLPMLFGSSDVHGISAGPFFGLFAYALQRSHSVYSCKYFGLRDYLKS